MSLFSQKEYLRYTRHLQLNSLGVAGQARLKQARIAIVGCGGLGSPVALYLAAAGVGHITLIDGDSVALSNLQRQVVFVESDIGQPKASAAQQHLQKRNSDICIDANCNYFSASNALSIVDKADLILDCSDNFDARFLINDACRATRTPWIYASVYQSSGQCAAFTPQSSCFRCLYPEPPSGTDDCSRAGVLGVLPGLLGTIQANEAIKLLLGQPSSIEGKLLMVETEELSLHPVKLHTRPHCPSCEDDFSFDVNAFAMRDSESVDAQEQTIDAADFHRYTSRDDVMLVDVRNAAERNAFDLGGTHIPLDELARNDALPMEKILLLYCQSGTRSAEGCELLAQRGFSARSVAGGIAEVLLHLQQESGQKN